MTSLFSCIFLNSLRLENKTTKPHQSLPVTFPDHTHSCNIQLLEIKTSHKNADTYIRFLVPVGVAWSVGKVDIPFFFSLLLSITKTYPKYF